MVDYVVLKLVKEKKAKTWDSLGSGISTFAVPESHTSYMRSNFLKQKVPEKKPEPVVEEENNENANPNVQPDEDDDRVVGDDMKGEKEFAQPGVIEK